MVSEQTTQVIDCPFASEINENLLAWIDDQEYDHISDGCYKTSEYTERSTPTIKKLFEWIEDLLPSVVDELAKHSNSLYNSSARQGTKKFKIDSYWGLIYTEGSQLAPHNHFPHAVSFGYYIDVPEKSGPLTILNNDKQAEVIQPKNGQLVVFMSCLTHWVEPTPVSGRCMIAGDVVYLSRF